ncbi:MAG: C39 family peptidase [Candidatus Gracilibacteria bacterium]|nr:C39 family peptidase [Candidatus Gracilibacteria bacterium]
MKRLMFLVVGMLLCFNTVAFGAVDPNNNNIYYVAGFYESTQSANNVLQKNTGANYSCGPTSLLLVKNYYWMKTFGFPAHFTTDLISAIMEIENVYNGMGKSYNTTTSTDELKSLVKNVWQWNTAVKASGNNSIATNFQTMVSRIKEDYPVILALKPYYSGNPIPGYAHIVVFYKYNGDTNSIYYFDPYYGGTHVIQYNDISNAIQGNLPYLRVAP